MWIPFMKENVDWLEAKEEEFTVKEIENLDINLEEWKQSYLYLYLNNFVFAEFPILL